MDAVPLIGGERRVARDAAVRSRSWDEKRFPRAGVVALAARGRGPHDERNGNSAVHWPCKQLVSGWQVPAGLAGHAFTGCSHVPRQARRHSEGPEDDCFRTRKPSGIPVSRVQRRLGARSAVLHRVRGASRRAAGRHRRAPRCGAGTGHATAESDCGPRASGASSAIVVTPLASSGRGRRAFDARVRCRRWLVWLHGPSDPCELTPHRGALRTRCAGDRRRWNERRRHDRRRHDDDHDDHPNAAGGRDARRHRPCRADRDVGDLYHPRRSATGRQQPARTAADQARVPDRALSAGVRSDVLTGLAGPLPQSRSRQARRADRQLLRRRRKPACEPDRARQRPGANAADPVRLPDIRSNHTGAHGAPRRGHRSGLCLPGTHRDGRR